MNEKEIKSYYERIEKLLNGANKETYGFVPEEIRNILRSYEILQKQNKQLNKRINKAIEYIENYMPYVVETDKEYEDVDGNTYYTYKEYTGEEIIKILKGE